MRRRRTAEEVARLLREADRDLAKGLTVSDWNGLGLRRPLRLREPRKVKRW